MTLNYERIQKTNHDININHTSVHREHRQTQLAKLDSNLRANVNNETDLSVLDLTVAHLLECAIQLNGASFNYDYEDTAIYVGDNGDSLIARILGGTFKLSRYDGTVGLALSHIVLDERDYKLVVPELLEALDALQTTHPAVTVNEKPVVSMYRRLVNDSDVTDEVASRLFTGWQLITMLLCETDANQFEADNGVVIRFNLNRVEIKSDDRTGFGRPTGSTLADQLSRPLVFGEQPDFERCVKVCEAVNQLLNEYSII